MPQSNTKGEKIKKELPRSVEIFIKKTQLNQLAYGDLFDSPKRGTTYAYWKWYEKWEKIECKELQNSRE